MVTKQLKKTAVYLRSNKDRSDVHHESEWVFTFGGIRSYLRLIRVAQIAKMEQHWDAVYDEAQNLAIPGARPTMNIICQA